MNFLFEFRAVKAVGFLITFLLIKKTINVVLNAFMGDLKAFDI